ncbi:MAG TPA: hypothetical protein PKL16_12270 [Anaerolineae bacterium]|nr:hypothetical protein [Anaerolineae bacterium]HQM15261.1 hypothetical protein [Anaerolineae bacterium]
MAVSVSGARHWLDLQEVGGIPILTAARFLARLECGGRPTIADE